MAADTHTTFIENMAGAVFGAFIGGEFLSVLLGGAGFGKPAVVTMTSIALSGAGAVIALMLLRMMRKAVGPLRSGKPKPRR